MVVGYKQSEGVTQQKKVRFTPETKTRDGNKNIAWKVKRQNTEKDESHHLTSAELMDNYHRAITHNELTCSRNFNEINIAKTTILNTIKNTPPENRPRKKTIYADIKTAPKEKWENLIEARLTDSHFQDSVYNHTFSQVLLPSVRCRLQSISVLNPINKHNNIHYSFLVAGDYGDSINQKHLNVRDILYAATLTNVTVYYLLILASSHHKKNDLRYQHNQKVDILNPSGP